MAGIYKEIKGDTSGKSKKQKYIEAYLKNRESHKKAIFGPEAERIVAGKSKQDVTDLVKGVKWQNRKTKKRLKRLKTKKSEKFNKI